MFKVENYVDNIQGDYSFVNIAKRTNNKKRDYLFVNTLLGKHIPQSPTKVLNHFKALYDKVMSTVDSENILVIGFAETATALAKSFEMFDENKKIVDTLLTTRNPINRKDGKVINFEEEHSHATEQKLFVPDCLPYYDTVIFVEDEITTGKTILNLLEKESMFKDKRIYVSSVLNWQNKDSQLKFKEQNINSISLVTGELKENTPLITEDFEDSNYSRIRDVDKYTVVMGTEEYMLEAIKYGAKLEKDTGEKVLTHSTTRSPIEVKWFDNYPIYSKHTLYTNYGRDRNVYFYNRVNRCNKLVIVTDEYNEGFVEGLTLLYGVDLSKVEVVCNGEKQKVEI